MRIKRSLLWSDSTRRWSAMTSKACSRRWPRTPSSRTPVQRRMGRVSRASMPCASSSRSFLKPTRHRFDIEEQFVAGDRCVVRWRYDWGTGHVRGVDVIRLRDGLIAETYSYVKG